MIPEEIFKELFELAKTHELSELSITTPDGKFRIRRGARTSPENVPVESLYAPLIQKVESKAEPDRSNLVKVVSPLMGVFYRTPAPGMEPFVSIGEKVNIGDTLCIVEAMKVMNEITADASGILEEILPQHGDVVEEGAILFFIKPEPR